MTTESTLGVRLLDVEPAIGLYLGEDDRNAARRIVVPTQVLRRGPLEICELLEQSGSFAAIILEGMVLHRVAIGEQVALRLVGPGDLLSLTKQPRSMLLSHAEGRVLAKTRLALFGREMLAGVQRWPQLLAGLHVRFAEQTDRVIAQLAICQLPRVDQRLMAILWLLAEPWGHVTPAGTSLPLALTHDVLGGLIGARRSTVTLALGELAERGALIRRQRGWLLLEQPPSYAGRLPQFEDPRLFDREVSGWEPEEAGGYGQAIDVIELHKTVDRLREQYAQNQERVRSQRERSAKASGRRA